MENGKYSNTTPLIFLLTQMENTSTRHNSSFSWHKATIVSSLKDEPWRSSMNLSIEKPFSDLLLPWLTLRKNCPYSDIFWSVFSRIRTEYREIRSIFLSSVRMRWNTDQKNSGYGHFLLSVGQSETLLWLISYN